MQLVRLQWHRPLFYLACNEISAQQQFCALWGAVAEDFPPLTRRRGGVKRVLMTPPLTVFSRGEKKSLRRFEMALCSSIAMVWLKKVTMARAEHYGVEATSLRHCRLRSPWGANSENQSKLTEAGVELEAKKTPYPQPRRPYTKRLSATTLSLSPSSPPTGKVEASGWLDTLSFGDSDQSDMN
ncbi:hypothetical protein L345_01011 [Ophiophagus hannah]|uniref:Uncharacterized protein n=1 Tax=Ophiophagus hannah TaxID=8665 RepID=V8PGR6_OPHHA|nr:hypothetical protein L345_01011 [Ophiophagus hannah]